MHTHKHVYYINNNNYINYNFFSDTIMTNRQAIGWAFLCLMGTTMMAPAFTHPQEQRSTQNAQAQFEQQRPVYQGQGSHFPVYQPEQDARKFAEKPNSNKKVVSSTAGAVVEDRNDLEDVQTNSISVRFKIETIIIYKTSLLKIGNLLNPKIVLHFSKMVASMVFGTALLELSYKCCSIQRVLQLDQANLMYWTVTR